MWIIIDWAYNRITNENFTTFDDAWGYILENLCTDDDDSQEYAVITEIEFNKLKG